MQGDDSEDDVNEGEEEGGEEEEDKEEEVKIEEVKVPEPPPRYYPKINPLTHILNINRDLDMLNSEVNLLSSQFMLTLNSGKAPQFTTTMQNNQFNSSFYNVSSGSYQSPSRKFQTYQSPPRQYQTFQSPPRQYQTYQSPVREHTAKAGYWSNPNHINISSSYNQAAYPAPTSHAQYANLAGQNYSPIRQQAYPSYQPDPSGSVHNLLQNIDKVLSPSYPVAPNYN